MTDPFPTIRAHFSEVQCKYRLSQILTNPKPNPASKIIDKIVEAMFDHNLQPIDFEAQTEAFLALPITKEQFYDLVRKETQRNLKKKEKAMESILLHMNSSQEINEETKKINSERHLRAFIISIEKAGAKLYRLIYQLQELRDWTCHCDTETCYAYKSLQKFQIDIFLYLLASSQIIAEAIRQHLYIETDLIVSLEDLMNHHARMGSEKLKELKFELEKPCMEVKEKKRKNKSKNRNKKNKNKKKIEEQEKEQEKEETDEDEKQLNLFLQKLDIVQEERVGCRVSEQWIFKIKAENYFTEK